LKIRRFASSFEYGWGVFFTLTVGVDMYVLQNFWADVCDSAETVYRVVAYFVLLVLFGAERANRFAEEMLERDRKEEAAVRAELQALIPKIEETFAEIRKVVG
jgi:hypothetical protein